MKPPLFYRIFRGVDGKVAVLDGNGEITSYDRVEILGPSEVIYDADNGPTLPTGARVRVWVETEAKLVVHVDTVQAVSA